MHILRSTLLCLRGKHLFDATVKLINLLLKKNQKQG